MGTSRTVLVTGAASGIGRRLAGDLLQRGDRVLATDVDEVGLHRAAEVDGWGAGEVLLRPLDVQDPAAWDDALGVLLARWGHVDLCLNVAGWLRPGNLLDSSPDDVARHLDVNARGVILGTRACARRMVLQGSGHVVNVGSLASLTPVPGLSLYTASEFAVRGFSLAAASELRPHGVHVSLVMPDAVETPMLDLQGHHDAAALTFAGARPLKLDEVSRLVLDRVLVERPLEVTLPTGRGGLARLAGVLPGVRRYLEPVLRTVGRGRQRRRRRLRLLTR